jgi:hypothetical protein
MLFVNDTWHITIVGLFLDHWGAISAIKVENAPFLLVTRNIRGFWIFILSSGLKAIDISARCIVEYSLILFNFRGFKTWWGFGTVDRNKNLILFMLFSIEQHVSVAWPWTIESSFPHAKFILIIGYLCFNIFIPLNQPLSNHIISGSLNLIRTILCLRLLIRQSNLQLLYWVNTIGCTEPTRINLREVDCTTLGR